MQIHYRILISLILLLFTLSIFFEFIVHLINQSIFLFPFVKKGFSLLCHQDEEKIINLYGIHSLVCARCTGIYLGMFLTSIYIIFKPVTKTRGASFFLILTLPMILDVVLVNLGFYNYSKYSAVITGLLFGSVVFVYFYNGLNLLISEYHRRQ